MIILDILRMNSIVVLLYHLLALLCYQVTGVQRTQAYNINLRYN